MYDAPLTVPAILLSLVLLVSGAAKLVDLRTAEEAFISLRLPAVLRRLKVPQALPVGEIILALALLVTSGVLGVIVNIAAVALFIGYFVVIVRALTFDETVECSCFGKLGLGGVDRFTAVRNAILVALAALSLYDATRGRSVMGRLLDFNGAQWLWLAGVLAAVALTWLISGHRGTDETGRQRTMDADGEYVRQPIPFGRLTRRDGTTVSFRELVQKQPVLVLYVSPTCGSCIKVIDKAREWQKQVPVVRTILAVPGQPQDTVYGLVDPEDFDIHFDPTQEMTAVFAAATPTAVLLGADGLLAGGPAVGTTTAMQLMDDIEAELNAAQAAEGMSDTTDTAADVPADHTREPAPVAPADTSALDHDTSGAVAEPASADEDLEEYLRRPTPYALLRNGANQQVSLFTMADQGPAVVLYVNPGCGPCVSAMEKAPHWAAQLPGIPVYYLVTSDVSRDTVVARGIDPELVLVDDQAAVPTMMQLGAPSMFALGADRMLLAGPVTGYPSIESTMEEIIEEVRGLSQPGATDESTDDSSSTHPVDTVAD